MTIPVFDIEYQSAYSTIIEFNTQINEKLLGYEQRYPVRTYPKRTFSVRFDKNFTERQQLENFYIATNGGETPFYFDWLENKGGNNKRYLCYFDSDSFEQTILDYGFSQSELTFIAIDDNSVQNTANLDFWNDAECNFSISYNTLKDSILTAQNNRKTYQNIPKKKWTLFFKKNSEIRKKAENFFISKRGKFKSFSWTWDSDKGGDGNTYNVRFDSDIFNVSVADYGFGDFSLDIIEVFSSENPLTEACKDEIIPRKLLKINLENGPICILDNETLESIEYEGSYYLGAPLKHGDIKKDDNSAVSKLNIEISNISQSISSIIANRGDVITNADAVLFLVFLNVNTNQIINNSQKILFGGKCNNLSLDYEKASFDIVTNLGGYEKIAPVMKYRPSCQVRHFKDCRCGYQGAETHCDRTFARCSQLGNTLNFRGFPSCVIETVIKA